MESDDKPWHATRADRGSGVTEDSDDVLAIQQMDGDYAKKMPANKTLTRIHVVLRDGTVETFQYHFLDVKSSFKGSEFEVIFAGTKHWKLTVKGHGKKFWWVYDMITLHRLPYLKEATDNEAKFSDKEQTMLTQIRITDVTPKPDHD